MAITSVRFNAKEEKILKLLKSTTTAMHQLFSKTLWDLYEDIKDREIIEEFEKKEDKSKTEFLAIEDIIS